MESGTRPVKGTRKMIASMTPVLQPGVFVFCSMLDNDDAKAAVQVARGSFAEDEGMSLILTKADADKLSLTYDQEMRQITLMVFSSLTGVGLTAAVTTELARDKIPANVVAATQHDHVFVPSHYADRAMELLRKLQERARDGG
ncbi:MAG: ACT domain-containing protein [Paracoccaceae bacterium]